MKHTFVANYVRILYLQGLSSIKSKKDVVIQEFGISEIGIFLSEDLESIYPHVCNSQGIGRMALRKFFHRSASKDPEKELEETIDEVKRELSAKFSKGVFLVIHGTKEIKELEFDYKRLENSLSFTFNGSLKEQILGEFNSIFGSILLKVLLCMKENLTLNYTEVGDSVFLEQPESKEIIYCLRFKAKGHAAAMGVLDGNSDDFEQISFDFVDDDNFEGVATLFLQSLNEAANNKEAYFNSWIALEKFIAKTFKEIAQKDWKKEIESAPKELKEYFVKNNQMKHNEPNLIGKLGLILLTFKKVKVIDNRVLSNSFSQFYKMKKNRDSIFHSKGFVEDELLNFDEIQKFLKKLFLDLNKFSSNQ